MASHLVSPDLLDFKLLVMDESNSRRFCKNFCQFENKDLRQIYHESENTLNLNQNNTSNLHFPLDICKT
jgi:hypothetical protein